MNVRVSDIAFDVNFVEDCSVNNQHLEGVLQQRKANPFRDKDIWVHSLEEAEDDELRFGNSAIYENEIFHSRGTILVSTNGELRQTQVHFRSNRACA